MRALLHSLRIRRLEFLVAEVPILLIPVLLSIRGAAALRATSFWEGVAAFFLMFHFGDMTNCLADRDLDAVYKPHLSRAVYGLGVAHVTGQIVATAVLALALAAHLAWRLDRWLLVPMVTVGLGLAAAYSFEPVRLKGRGLAHLACLWLVIFIGPMGFAALLVSPFPSAAVLALSAAYATLQMGTLLVNTAEDYPEDRQAAVRTTIIALGLHRGLALARAMAVAGAAGLVGVLGALFWLRGVAPAWTLALLPAAAGCSAAALGVARVAGAIRGLGEREAVPVVRRAARWVPAWLAVVAWTTLGAAAALFAHGRGP